jgi:hypothetical protein
MGSVTLNLARLATCSSPIELHLQIEPIPGIEISLLITPSDQSGFDDLDQQSIDNTIQIDSSIIEQQQQQSFTRENSVNTIQEKDLLEIQQAHDLEITMLVI